MAKSDSTSTLLDKITGLEGLTKEIQNANTNYGILITILVAIVIVGLFFSWIYFRRKVETIAEISSEKSIRKFQQSIDKDLHRFKSTHQKQIDVIHDIYVRLTKLTRMINYLLKGEKFTSSGNPHEEVEHLFKLRHDFHSNYFPNKIIFPKSLCEKIENILPEIDKFIETYKDGLFPPDASPVNYQIEHEEAVEEGTLYLAGVWSDDTLQKIEIQLNEISVEIETEFRKIYGTEI